MILNIPFFEMNALSCALLTNSDPVGPRGELRLANKKRGIMGSIWSEQTSQNKTKKRYRQDGMKQQWRIQGRGNTNIF